MSAEPEASPKEARRAERVRTILGARAVFNGGRSSIDCQIRNVSPTGARLALAEGLSLPGDFDLEIPARNRRHHVILRWRTKDAAGVQFVDAPAQAQAQAGSPEAEMEALRAENAVLRRRVAELARRLAELGYSDLPR